MLAANVLADFKHVHTEMSKDFRVPRVCLDEPRGHEVGRTYGLHLFGSGKCLKQAVQSGPDNVLRTVERQKQQSDHWHCALQPSRAHAALRPTDERHIL